MDWFGFDLVLKPLTTLKKDISRWNSTLAHPFPIF
jgi:hypothetical protein